MLTTLIVYCAKYLFALAPLTAAYVWWRSDTESRRLLLMRGAVVLIVAVALAKLGGMLYNEQRPFVLQHTKPLIPHVPDNGFPSDHTLLSFACAFLVLPFHRRAFLVALLVSCAVGLARVASLLHSPLDVAVSTIFAAIANGVSYLLVRPRSTRGNRAT